MFKFLSISLAILFSSELFAQLPIARDTITVLENNYTLKMPWAGGLNYTNVSNIDLNFDGIKDIVVFDRQNQYGAGVFKCFINTGTAGQVKYKHDPGLSYYFPKAYNWALFFDYNKDGLEDLFCSSPLGIMVYKNTSTTNNLLNFTLSKTFLESDYNPGGAPSMANLYAAINGVPGISDIDNDGDLDILTFSPFGVLVEFHKNMAKENNLSLDSLLFDLGDYCWGKIAESNCSVDFNQCMGSVSKLSISKDNISKPYHAGSCLMCFDSDGDQDKDLLMGDVSCNVMQYIHNGGSSFTDTTKLYPNYPNKNSTQKIRFNNFPCAYSVDVDGDLKKDLVASPNANNGENFNSMWYYKNVSVTNTVNFQFVKNNLFQDEMIEVGQNSFPVVFDYNADGKKDLLIGTYGYYLNNSLSSKLTLYQNIGTTTQPIYSLVSRDYASLSSYGLNNCMPTVGDIDGDGDVDICLGTSSGQIHWLENTAGPNMLCNFSVFKNNPFNFTTQSSAAAPQLVDLDQDGKLDLVIGTKNGKLAFYKNIGTPTAPSFSLTNSFLGNIQVQGDPYVYLSDGYAVPYFYKEGSDFKLLVGSVDGSIYQYSVPTQINTTFSLITKTTNNINEGSQAAPCFEDVNGDGKRDLILGTASGGLTFFSSASTHVGINEQTSITNHLLKIFPNPAGNELYVVLENNPFENAQLSIYDLSGRLVIQKTAYSNAELIDVSGLQNGLYVIRLHIYQQGKQFSVIKKFSKSF